MSDSDNLGGEADQEFDAEGLSLAEQDSTANFWFNDVGQTVTACGTTPPPAVVSQNKKHWIEISMVDQEGNPVAGESYAITIPDGTIQTGSLNAKGRARIDGIDAGTCKITFPKLDKDCWKAK
jgi:hypothetical protein